jgi:hypothetical protein
MNDKGLLISLALATLLLSACSTSTMQTDKQSKAGFSNITDTPLPLSAKMDLHRSMVTGSGANWSGHLVYTTEKPLVQVVDFINREMQTSGWTKISELRGHETVMTFMKEKRIASARITAEKGFMSNTTLVAIDMANSSLRHVVTEYEEKDLEG